MSNTASQLLQKVKNAINYRETENKVYLTSFQHPVSFITATINGKQEFVPINLLCRIYDRYQTLLELYQVFGTPEANAGLNLRLKEFYNQYGIEWPSYMESTSITYYIKPAPPKQAGAFFNTSAIEKLSSYAGTKYNASDAFLKDLGKTFADEIVDTTNAWAKSLNVPTGYVVEQERYWQVAGRFKSFTWAKIYKEEFEDKKIFFSVGVDIQNKELEIKLDVLRSGTHKLSNFEIRDFDYFTEDSDLALRLPLDQINRLNLGGLTFLANQFITDYKETYEQAIDFIWNDSVDCSLFENKLFKLGKNYSSNVDPSLSTINNNEIASLIISYEQFVLSHAGREELTNAIKIEQKEGLELIQSFEVDGKPRTILFKASTGGTTTEFEMSREEIEFLGDNLHTFLYHVVEYNSTTNSGKLVIRKGSPTQYAELRSIQFKVKVA